MILLECIKFTKKVEETPIEKFYTYCMLNVDDKDVTTQHLAYKIYLMCYFTNLKKSKVKTEILKKMMIDIIEEGSTKKIFRDTLMALNYDGDPKPAKFAKRQIECYSNSLAGTLSTQIINDINGFENLIC